MQNTAQKNSLLLLTEIIVTVLLIFIWIAETEAKVPALIVFGDSTVDAGNNNVLPTTLKANFPPYGRDFMEARKPTGRFSNGRVATDFYSEMYGLRSFVPAYLDPEYGIEDFAVGVCFASAGTGIDPTTAGVLVNVVFFFVTCIASMLFFFNMYKSSSHPHTCFIFFLLNYY